VPRGPREEHVRRLAGLRRELRFTAHALCLIATTQEPLDVGGADAVLAGPVQANGGKATGRDRSPHGERRTAERTSHLFHGQEFWLLHCAPRYYLSYGLSIAK